MQECLQCVGNRHVLNTGTPKVLKCLCFIGFRWLRFFRFMNVAWCENGFGMKDVRIKVRVWRPKCDFDLEVRVEKTCGKSRPLNVYVVSVRPIPFCFYFCFLLFLLNDFVPKKIC